MSFLGAVVGGMGKGVSNIAARHGQNILEEARAVREESRMKLGIELKEGSDMRLAEHRANLDRTSFEHQLEATSTHAAETLPQRLNEARKMAELASTVDRESKEKMVNSVIEQLGSGLEGGLPEAFQRSIKSQLLVGADVFAPKEMSDKEMDFVYGLYETTYEEMKAGEPWFGTLRKKKSESELRALAMEHALLTHRTIKMAGQAGGFREGVGISEDQALSNLTSLVEKVGGVAQAYESILKDTKLTDDQKLMFIGLLPRLMDSVPDEAEDEPLAAPRRRATRDPEKTRGGSGLDIHIPDEPVQAQPLFMPREPVVGEPKDPRRFQL